MKSNVISGKTKVCGVIGDPIEHTMSPVMQNTAFSQLGLDYVYVAFRVKGEVLGEAIGGMRGFGIAGLNVTIPHKVAVIPFLDELDPLAKKIGAVNTITNNDGVLKGYNTDAMGFLRTLLDRGVKPEGKNIVILGAGGASKALSFILAENGANLSILNRREELDWAENLARQISHTFRKEVPARELNEANLAAMLEKANVLVNATSVGMIPNTSGTPVSARLLRPELVVFDIVYNPTETRLLREAAQAGAKTIGGLTMLAWQGALAFEMWTGNRAPVELMEKEAIKFLEGKQI